MKRYFKLSAIFAMVFTIVFTAIPLSAQSENISFEDPLSGLTIKTEFETDKYILKEEKEGSMIWYAIYEIGNENEDLEAWGFDMNERQTRNQAWTHTYRVNLGADQGYLVNTVSLRAARNGSFRWFNGLNYHVRGMSGQGVRTSISTDSGSVKTPGDGETWPASTVYVAFTTTVNRSVTISESVSISGKLVNAGWSLGTTRNYYKTITKSYSIVA